MSPRDRILVQIPAYRDPELMPTVLDLLRTAACPERLSVVIAWQYGEDERELEKPLRRLAPVRLLMTRAANSQGCNWARRELQRCWSGEEFTLLLDSHHRFAPGWDATLVNLHRQLRDSGIERPVMTAYLPPYDPVRDPQGRVEAVYRMALLERRKGLMFRLTGHPVPGWRKLTRPIPACFASLHLLFAEGRFNEVVACDPDIYFFADEIAIALRAFTHGYDLFHPHVVLGWHLYDRTTRGRHWDDHIGSSRQREQSIERLRSLYAGRYCGRYGIGDQRTLAEYEQLTGEPLLARKTEPLRWEEDHVYFARGPRGTRP
ncbi:GlcNAc-transferase family protein [Pseudonocardia hierapolitana]|uniref:GlcNAc-transferase family protein n=1 Tax=Pseudonocardia hierapolitana TaxID=1128676 RepID=UPI0011BF24CD|nr:GlcNAc-transferase family protein [Pseudonocardia hierapolitana]